MSDIVERLRDPLVSDGAIRLNAASEIERLRILIFAGLFVLATAQGALLWRTNELRLQVEAELRGAHSETQRLGRAAAIFDRAVQTWWDGHEYEIDLSPQNWKDDPEYQDI